MNNPQSEQNTQRQTDSAQFPSFIQPPSNENRTHIPQTEAVDVEKLASKILACVPFNAYVRQVEHTHVLRDIFGYLAPLTQRIAELRKERDAWKEMCQQRIQQVVTLDNAKAAAEARVKELERDKEIVDWANDGLAWRFSGSLDYAARDFRSACLSAMQQNPQEKGTSPPAQSASLPSTAKSPEPGSPDSGSRPASAANPGAGTPPADS